VSKADVRVGTGRRNRLLLEEVHGME
jgi:hypothetical protein